MHLGMPECHKPFLGHCDLDLWPSFQELLCPEHISYIIWCRNPKFGVVIPLGMAEWCIQFWVILTLTLTSGFISRFFLLYYSYLSSNVSCARPIPLGAFVTCLWHFLFFAGPGQFTKRLLIIPPANFVCRGYTVFTLSVRPSVRPCVRPSVRPSVRNVTLCFLNNSKSHCWIFIKTCKHVHICKTNTLDKKVRARGQFY